MIAGSFLIIGGLLAFVYSLVGDHLRASRQERRRFDDEIREVHLKFYRAAAHFTRRVDLTWSDDSEQQIRIEVLDSALATMSDAIAELNIIADNAVLAKATEAWGTAHDVKAAVEEGNEVTPSLLEAVDYSLHRLVTQMRVSLRLEEKEKVTKGM